jgi:hypothetical protein
MHGLARDFFFPWRKVFLLLGQSEQFFTVRLNTHYEKIKLTISELIVLFIEYISITVKQIEKYRVEMKSKDNLKSENMSKLWIYRPNQ